MNKMKSVHPKALGAALIILSGWACPLSAEPINAGPAWEVGMGVEHVSVELSKPGAKGESGWGGQPVFGRMSLLGAMTRSASGGKWMIGDYLALGAGGWYGESMHIRIPLDVGAQIGAVLAGEYQVVAKGGIMGIGTSGGESAGGFGAYFLSLRGKWQDYAIEAGGALRKDTDEGGAAGLMMMTGRWYISDLNLGVRFMNATRRIDPPSKNTLTDRSVLLFISLET